MLNFFKTTSKIIIVLSIPNRDFFRLKHCSFNEITTRYVYNEKCIDLFCHLLPCFKVLNFFMSMLESRYLFSIAYIQRRVNLKLFLLQVI